MILDSGSETRIASALRVFRMVWGAFLVSQLTFLGFAALLVGTVGGRPAASPASSGAPTPATATPPALLAAFALAAVVCLSTSFLIRFGLARMMRKPGGASLQSVLDAYCAALILGFAFAEGAGILGLIATFYVHDLRTYIPFFLAAVLAIFVQMPRRSEIEGHLEEG